MLVHFLKFPVWLLVMYLYVAYVLMPFVASLPPMRGGGDVFVLAVVSGAALILIPAWLAAKVLGLV